MKFGYWKFAKDSNSYWRLKAANNEAIAQSPGYASKGYCLAPIQLVKSASIAAETSVSAS